MREERGVPLSELTTLRLGGPAARLVRVTSPAELVAAVCDLDAREEPLLVLGGGSNLVVADEGFAGTVVRVEGEGLAAERVGEHVDVTAWAGSSWDALVERAVGDGLSGVECLSGIPGSVGATPLQNVGAYGQEVSETIAAVRVLDRSTREESWIAGADCGFAYRTSRFRGSDRYVVLEVKFRLRVDELSAPIRYGELARALGLEGGGHAPSVAVRAAVLALRRSKGMVLDPADPDTVSAGSFFTNPIVDPSVVPRITRVVSTPPPTFPQPDGRVKLAAAWLIERAGFGKGTARAGAAISTKHALALVSRGGSTRDLLALASEVQGAVKARFGVTLEPEPILVGCSL